MRGNERKYEILSYFEKIFLEANQLKANFFSLFYKQRQL